MSYKTDKREAKRKEREAEALAADRKRSEEMRCMFEEESIHYSVCNYCGAVVRDEHIHYEFHQRVGT